MQLNNTLSIADTLIRQDDDGRYCLNDLHKAAGGAKKHQPSNFMRLDSTSDLMQEIKEGILRNEDSPLNGGNLPVVTINDGIRNGTYVCKELVYAYAMWISPVFSLKVIRAYDALVTHGIAAPQPESSPPAMLTPEQYEAERTRLQVMQERLHATPIIVMPEDYERLTGERVRVGKRTYNTTDLVGVLEDCGVPREAIKKILGADSNYVRQYAYRARHIKTS